MTLAAPATIDALRRASEVVREDAQEIHRHHPDLLEWFGGQRVLVTGASGLLGGHLAEVLLLANTLVDGPPRRLVLMTRKRTHLEGRLGHLLDLPEVDIVESEGLSVIDVDGAVDIVIHAGAPASPRAYNSDPTGSTDSNTVALRNLLLLAHQKSSPRFLYISSSEVYGDPPPEAIPTSEEYAGAVEPLSARAWYAESKRAGETICHAYHHVHGINAIVVRPFHVHGPGLRLDDGRIVAALLEQALQGAPLTLLSDGSAVRCYAYAGDVTAGMLLALQHGTPARAYNLGINQPVTTVLDIATAIAGLCDLPAPVVAAVPPPDHLASAPARAVADLRRAADELGYQARVSLGDGLARTIRWHRLLRGQST